MLYSNSRLFSSFGVLMCIVKTSFSRENGANEELLSRYERQVNGPFTDHFIQWLEKNGYADHNFTYGNVETQASFGGKISDNDKINNYPVIFIHGNSDGALSANSDVAGSGHSDDGWSASIAEFLQNGYKSAELYAITYGDRQLKNALYKFRKDNLGFQRLNITEPDTLLALQLPINCHIFGPRILHDMAKNIERTMDCETVIRHRRFVEAVLTYTNSSYVHIISHSMGVSLARRLIKGGNLMEPGKRSVTELNSVGGEDDNFNECYIGESIHHKVHTFIGIAGANYGMCFCADEQMARTIPACGKTNGFWPGTCDAINDIYSDCGLPMSNNALKCGLDHQYSSFLLNLNADYVKEARFIVSMWSDDDEILGLSNFAWGKKTSLIPQSDKSVVYNNLSHYEVKTKTAKDQFIIISSSQLY